MTHPRPSAPQTLALTGWRTTIAVICFAAALTGCDPKQESSPEPQTPPTVSTLPVIAPHIIWLASEQALRNSLDAARQLNQQITLLLANPSDDNLTAARAVWHVTHNHYSTFLPFISMSQAHRDLFPGIAELHQNLDAWPMMPGYIDSVAAYPHSGIVNDIALPLNATTLREQHGLTDSYEVSLGFHALAYLLWGEQGTRPPADFLAVNSSPGDVEVEIAELPNNRRRTYLQLATNLLVDDLVRLLQQWQTQQTRLQKLSAGAQWALIEKGMSAALTQWQQLALECQQTQVPAVDATTPDFSDDEQHHNRFSGGAPLLLKTVLTSWLDTLNQLNPDGSRAALLLRAWQPIKEQVQVADPSTPLHCGQLRQTLIQTQLKMRAQLPAKAPAPMPAPVPTSNQ